MFSGTKSMWFLKALKSKEVAHRIVQGIQYEEELVVLPDLLLSQPLIRILPPKWMDTAFSITGAMNACVSMTGRGSTWVLKKANHSTHHLDG